MYQLYTYRRRLEDNIFLSICRSSAGLSIPPLEILAEVGLGATVSLHLATFDAVASAPGATIVHAPGLPALKKPVVQNILEGQFIDFTELSPAKGRTKAVTVELEGQVLYIPLQASDLIKAKHMTPDLGTWLQCYAAKHCIRR